MRSPGQWLHVRGLPLRAALLALALLVGGCATLAPSVQPGSVYTYSVLWTADGIGREGASVRGEVTGCLYASDTTEALTIAHRLMSASVPRGELLADRITTGCE